MTCKRCGVAIRLHPVGKPYCVDCLAYWRTVEQPKVIRFPFAKSLDQWPRGAA